MLENDLFESSLRLINFLTFILLNLFSSLVLSRRAVINNELPSFKIFLFCSKISENINSSKIPPRSVNLITAYELPFWVFFSCNFKIVAARFASLASDNTKSLKFFIL